MYKKTLQNVSLECAFIRIILSLKYSVIQKDGLNFIHIYFLNYTWYVNDLHNI